jgi:hypothetical protein
MRHLRLAATALVAVLALPAAAQAGHRPIETAVQGPEHQAGGALNMEVVGQHNLGGRGYNADVWVHEEHAYVGSWGFSDWNTGGEERFCPNDGVAVIDSRDPANPKQVSTLVSPEGTSAEDVVVFTARFGPLAGRDIAAVGIQVCGGSRYDATIFRGLQLFDVTNPAAPLEIENRLDTGCCTRGLHELEFQHRPDLGRTFVYASVPASEYPDALSPTGVRDQQMPPRGDFRLIDVTDPAMPVEVSDWGVVKDTGGPLGPGLGCDPDPIFGHSVEPSADGRLAFVAYWDSGFVALDLSDPATPVFRGTTSYEFDEDGDGHSSNFDEGRELLFTADEDFCKTSGSGTEKGFGYLRVYDYSGLDSPGLVSPVQIGEYRTPNSSGSKDVGAGDYTIHNPLIVGTDLYISWYSDGIRVVDAEDPRNLREVAFFVPPSAKNPVQPSQRGTLTNATQVWGVAYDHSTDLVYASDMNSGLWILRRTGP